MNDHISGVFHRPMAGVVKRIRLENFMCHSHLEIELGDSVNFITGQNGMIVRLSSASGSIVRIIVFYVFGAMKCFSFSIGDKKDEQKTNQSTLTDGEMKRSGSELNSQNISDASTESLRRNSYPSFSQRPSNLKIFTVPELKSATKNFSRSAMLGEGGFGCVYKGLIKSSEDPSGKLEVVVKKLSKRGLQGHKEWVTEVNVLGVVEHPNLVKLVGYCAEDDERGIQRLLIYEYMPNGSVEDHISSQCEIPLPWNMRLKIAQDAARGLAYLHEGMDFQIIFRDFKSSNILLDDQWNVKLSDFGMARLGPTEGLTHVSTAVVGTMGYAAPEYLQTGRLTYKNDVWSYGVFLYELITGRRPIDKSRPKSEQKLLDWVRPHLSDSKKFRLIIDPRLEGKYPLNYANVHVEIKNEGEDALKPEIYGDVIIIERRISEIKL